MTPSDFHNIDRIVSTFFSLPQLFCEKHSSSGLSFIQFTAFPSRAAGKIVFPAGPGTLFLTYRFGTCRLEGNKSLVLWFLCPLFLNLTFLLETSICQGIP